MSKDKVVTVYIPSGMRINQLDDLCLDEAMEMSSNMFSTPKQSKTDISSPQIKQESNSPKNLPTCDQKETNSQAHTQRNHKSKPVTICKNKSRTVEDYNFKINETVIFDVDAESLKEALNQLKGSASSTETESHLKLTSPEPICNTARIPKTETLPITSRSKLYEKLKKITKLRKERNEKAEIEIEDSTKIKNCEYSEPKESGKQSCQCVQCDEFINCTIWQDNNVRFKDSTAVSKNPVPFLRANIQSDEINITKIFDSKIILHGVVIPKALFALDETHFHPSIANGLQSINCTTAKTVQSHMWPAVQRGLNVFMIGARESGKTLAYLPAFCSFAMEKNGRYSELSKYEGPLVLVLCPNGKKCEELNSLIRELMKDCLDAVRVEVLTEDSLLENDNPCDILVTVPSVLEDCLKSGTVKLKRLFHLAIEDGHLSLKNHSQSVEKLCNILNKLQINRPHNKNIQVVVCSEQWTVDLETLLKNLYTSPLVCFEDFLEAAKYSKVEFKKKKLKSSHKLFYLEDILKNNYSTHKTVVFCNDAEISTVKQHLEVSGVEFISIQNDLIEDEIFENEDMWCYLKNGRYKVLLCSDTLFEKTVHILNANWVVHFSRPSSWAQFQKRFRCLSASFCSPLTTDETYNIYQNQDRCSFLLVDETCNNEILDFFEVLTRSLIKHLQL